MGDEWDAVVVGSGPNGLVGGAILAGAGWRVLVLEAASAPGGGLRTAELTLPGFRHDLCATVVPLAAVSPALTGLDLAADGVRLVHPPVPLAHPLDGRPAALLRRDLDVTADRFGASAGRAYRRLMGPLTRETDRIVPAVLAAPRPPGADPLTYAALARFAAAGIRPATGLARRALAGEPARALFAGLAAHSMIDLDRPGTAGYGLLLGMLGHTVGWPVVAGGSGALADALVGRIARAGGSVVTGTRVASLAEVPPASAVLLDVTPGEFVRLAGDALPARYQRALARFRHGGGVFKVDWALAGPVPWTDPAVAEAGTVHLGGPLDEVAAAERQVAAGRHPDRPFVLFVQAGVADPTRAPAGQHTGWAYCHVPAGSTVDRTAAIEAQVERFAPGFRDLILARHVTTPAAFEARNPNLVGGDIGGGATDLRGVVARPVARPSPWRTPLDGVYLCSASTPPGAGVHGMAGAQAARLALRRAASLTRGRAR